MNAYNHSEFNLTHQRSEIDAEERRLIDEAIAAGKVQTIPQGNSTFAEEYVWEGDKNDKHTFGKLVPVNPLTLQERRAKYNRQFSQRKKNPATTQKRNETKRLSLEGHSRKDIAEFLGISEGAVKAYQQQLVNSGQLPKRSSNGLTQEEVAKRRDKVLECINQGLVKKQICEALGLTVGVVQNDRDALVKQGRLRRRGAKNGVRA